MAMIPKILAGIGKSAVAGFATGLSSGISDRTRRLVNRGVPGNAIGPAMASTHEQMFGAPQTGSQGFQFEMQRLEANKDIRLQQMKDATTIELQKMQMKHDAMMHSVSKGHKGVAEIIDFIMGRDKSQFYNEYRKLKRLE